jgi:hypothetical protein
LPNGHGRGDSDLEAAEFTTFPAHETGMSRYLPTRGRTGKAAVTKGPAEEQPPEEDAPHEDNESGN